MIPITAQFNISFHRLVCERYHCGREARTNRKEWYLWGDECKPGGSGEEIELDWGVVVGRVVSLICYLLNYFSPKPVDRALSSEFTVTSTVVRHARNFHWVSNQN